MLPRRKLDIAWADLGYGLARCLLYLPIDCGAARADLRRLADAVLRFEAAGPSLDADARPGQLTR
jgi:hypothetical protein